MLGDALDCCDVLQVFIELILFLLDASPVECSFSAKTCSLLFELVDLSSLDCLNLLLSWVPVYLGICHKLVDAMLKELSSL